MVAGYGASKTIIERLPPALKSLIGVPTSIIHVTGITQKGPVGEVRGPFGSWTSWKRVYGGLINTSYLPIAVWAVFRAPRGLKRIYTTRITHYTDADDKATSTAVVETANLSGNTLLPTAGAIQLTGLFPINLSSGETLVVHCDADMAGPDTATFTGTPARLVGGAYGVVPAGGTITIKSYSDPDDQVFTFVGGEAVAAAAALINTTASHFKAIVVGGATLDFECDTEGTDSRIEVVSDSLATAAALGHTAPSVQVGGGNVGDVDAITFAEAKAIIEAAVIHPVTGLVCTDVGGAMLITSNTTGLTSSIQITGASTATGFGIPDNLVHSGAAGSTVTVWKVNGKYPGDLGLSVDVENPTDGEATHWKLKVYQGTDLVETWDNIEATVAGETTINNDDTGSAWIEVEHVLDYRPTNVAGSALAGGNDGLVGLVDADYIGEAGSRSTRLLPDYIALRAIPGRSTAIVQPDLVAWCEETNSYGVLAGPLGQTVAGIRTYVKTTATLKGLSEYAGFYWPNTYLANPDEDVYGSDASKVLVPCEGSVLAAIIVQDSKPGGVHEAAGGLENGQLPGVVDIETTAVYDEANRDALYPDRINIIHHMGEGEPFFIDGSRTLRDDGPFPSIGESRGVIYITQTVKRYVDPKRHKNITLRLLDEMRNTITLFLNKETKLGAFYTDDPKKAFYVDTSENVNPASERAAHRLHVLLGLAKAEPAEWIILEVTKDVRAMLEELGL
jgi:hypothetical protein